MSAAATPSAAPHVPVLISSILEACAPIQGHWVDGTFGAGGYARALLDAGAARVTGIDRDPLALDLSRDWVAAEPRLSLVQGRFSDLEALVAPPVDGVVFDLGVSSMQLDRGERGFSFRAEGPLDMRMSQEGPSAADIVARATEAQLADIFFHYGEERAARRIARAVVRAREGEDITTTTTLAEIVERCLPRAKPGQVHPATRTFQALRIAVNDELGELASGLEAAERALKPGGWLAVVSFHSLEDRVVKRFFQSRSGRGGGSRHAPAAQTPPASFEARNRGVTPAEAEVAANPRARSATLRVGRRTNAAPIKAGREGLGLPPAVDV